ncbi:MAG: patatin-like phospholipase family protein [Gemmatimonadales bacterium]|nr:patatin-like phospholipase family protein [Gemmatimonadales bacterium]
MSGIAVVLSGGGAKAAAHLGAMRAVAAAGLVPSRYVATSMGAVLAVGLAAGLAPDAVLERWLGLGAAGLRRRRFAPLQGLFARSLLDPGPFRDALAGFLPVQRFGQLRVPVTVTTSDVDRGTQVLFGDGGEDAPLVDVLAAACALPLYLPPVPVGGRRLADGGLHGVLPLDVVVRFAPERVIAVNVGTGEDDGPPARASARPPLLEAHDAATGALMGSLTASLLAWYRAVPGHPPLAYVRPRLDRDGTFALDRARAFFAAGEAAASAALV